MTYRILRGGTKRENDETGGQSWLLIHNEGKSTAVTYRILRGGTKRENDETGGQSWLLIHNEGKSTAVTYRILRGGTKRGNDKIVDSLGFSYTMKVSQLQ